MFTVGDRLLRHPACESVLGQPKLSDFQNQIPKQPDRVIEQTGYVNILARRALQLGNIHFGRHFHVADPRQASRRVFFIFFEKIFDFKKNIKN